jgi:hypothetical protein
LPLPDGRALFPGLEGARFLQVARRDERPVALLGRDTASPACLIGSDQVAVLLGQAERPQIAVVSLRSSLIQMKVETPPGGNVSQLAAAPDGSVLYCVADGQVWAVNLRGERPRPEAFCAGDRVGVGPDGALVVWEEATRRLLCVPAKGGPGAPIPVPGGPLKIHGMSLTDRCVAKDGRLILSVVAPDTYFWQPALFDPRAGEMKRLDVSYDGDLFAFRWGEDGRTITATGSKPRTELWRFRRKA